MDEANGRRNEVRIFITTSGHESILLRKPLSAQQRIARLGVSVDEGGQLLVQVQTFAAAALLTTAKKDKKKVRQISKRFQKFNLPKTSSTSATLNDVIKLAAEDLLRHLGKGGRREEHHLHIVPVVVVVVVAVRK